MPDIRWKAPATPAVLASTELNSLAANARAEGAVLDNTTSRHIFGSFALRVTFASAPTADSIVALYLVPALDGTNYADGSAAIAPGLESFAGNFIVKNSTSTQRLIFPQIQLQPFRYKPLIINSTSQSFSASGNTLEFVGLQFESV